MHNSITTISPSFDLKIKALFFFFDNTENGLIHTMVFVMTKQIILQKRSVFPSLKEIHFPSSLSPHVLLLLSSTFIRHRVLIMLL